MGMMVGSAPAEFHVFPTWELNIDSWVLCRGLEMGDTCLMGVVAGNMRGFVQLVLGRLSLERGCTL